MQFEDAQGIIAELTKEKVFMNPIVTELAPVTDFYPAEDYHRDSYRRTPSKPYCQAVIAPTLSKVRSHWKAMLKAAQAETV